jgi:hypothetical protein
MLGMVPFASLRVTLAYYPPMLPLLLLVQITSHDAQRYDITLIPSDTGTHLLGEVETAWRLQSADPVGVVLDSSMRVVRVLIDGRPNTRLSRTMYGRSEDDLVVPHQKRAGDSITTRVRYHGLARGAARVGTNRRGERIFFATGQGGGARFWLPVPEQPALDRAAVSIRVQAPLTQRVLAGGTLVGVDTLPYGDGVWRYRMDDPAPIAAFGVAAGAYQVDTLPRGRCGDGCIAVELWRYAGSEVRSEAAARLPAILDRLAAKTGRFPYARLVHAEAPVDAVTVAPGIVFHPEGTLGAVADSTVALATARQWFGVAVSPATPEDGWLIDGVARSLASLEADSSGGARVLHRLRAAAGDSAFFAGISRLARERLHRSAGRDDLVAALSAAAGRDLKSVVPRSPDAAR